MLDMTDTIVPKSDQMNSDDLMSGPRTFTISEVYKTGSEDQPFAVLLAEFDRKRPFKPSKSMRRVMVTAWGPDGDAYVGKRLTLYRDPDVKFGAQEVGGIRISHMSGIAKSLKLALTVTKGKRANYVVQPLADEPARAAQKPAEPSTHVPTAQNLRDDALAAQGDVDELRSLYAQAQNRHLDGAEVIDDHGDTVTLGDLIRRLGEEARRGAA